MYDKSLQSLPSHYMMINKSDRMAKERITVTMDRKLIKALRFRQAQQIQETARSVSLSQMISEILKKGL